MTPPASARILLVSQPTEAGTARHVADLAEGLAGRGVDVTVACPGEGMLPDRIRHAGVPMVELPMRRDISPLADLVALVRLVGLLRRLRPDVLHAHSSKAGFLGRIAGRFARAPVVVFTPHSWSFQSAQGWRRALYVMLERFASRFCDMTVTVSEREAIEAVDIGVLPASRVRVIPNGVSTAEFETVRADKTIPFLSVGRLDEQKGYSYLLEAMAELTASRPDARLTIVGDGALRPALEKQAADLGLNGVVTFEGERSDVGAYLHRASVFVLSSLWEGLPYTIIEAMAARLPVVSTDVGGCGELVSDGETGLLVPARDPGALADAMGRLLGDATLRDAMGDAGFARARDRFRVEDCVESNARLYGELTEAHHARIASERTTELLGPRTTVVAVLLALLMLGVVFVDRVAMADRIVPGVTVGGADVGGLTVNDAARVIDGLAANPVRVSVTPTSVVMIAGADLDLDVTEALDRAYLTGRVGSLPERLVQRVAALRGEIAVQLEAGDRGEISGLLDQARSRLGRAPEDAGFEFEGDRLRATSEVPGVRVDEQALFEAIGSAATAQPGTARDVRVPVVSIRAGASRAQAAALLAEAEIWSRFPVVGTAPGASVTLAPELLASLFTVRDGALSVSAQRMAGFLQDARIPTATAKDARFTVVRYKASIIDGTAGTQIDATSTALALQGALESGSRSFPIVTRHYEPNTTGSDLARIDVTTELSTYTTRFKLGQDGRDTNISLAAGAVRGLVLGVGEVFSLNEVTGPRNRATGYQESLIFSGGKVVPGVGGGVCQVSTTIYQAALRAGLRIVDRQSHSMAVSYVRPGLDATTFYPIVDLKFQNSTSAPLLLWTEVRGDALTVSVFGAGEKPDVRIETVVKKTIAPGTRTVYDPNLRHNVKVVEIAGVPGYVVASFRSFYEAGQLVKREPLAVDEYQPRKRVVGVGY